MPSTGGEERVHAQVVRGSVWYIVSVSILALGGFAYWSLAARIASSDLGDTAGKELVDQASTLFAFLLFVNWLTSMGLPVAVARFAPANTRAVNSLFGWALVLTTASSLAGTLAFFAGAVGIFPDDNTAPLFGSGKVLGLLLFFALVTGQSMAVLVETRLVTLRQWGWVVARVAIVVASRFPLFLIPAMRSSPIGLFLIMAGPPAISGFVGAFVLRRWGSEHAREPLLPVPPSWRPALQFSLVNYAALLASQSPQFVLPLIVRAQVVDDDFAAFYLAWTVANVVFLLPHVTSQTVLAEASRDRSRVAHQVRLGMLVAGGITVALTVGAYAFGGWATLLFFGDSYELTASVLPRMVAAGIPWVVTAMLLARARVLLLSVPTVVITAAFAVLTLVPTAILAGSNGVEGAANAWFFGNVAAAGVAILMTVLYRNASPRLSRSASLVDSAV